MKTIDEDDSERRQRLARFYARRERFQKAFLELGLASILDNVVTTENKLGISFNKNKFFDEVRNPEKCLIID